MSKVQSPYLKKSPPIRQMKGAPVPTMPGVIGQSNLNSTSRSVGGLVMDTKHLSGPLPGLIKDSKACCTENGAVQMSPPKTKMSGHHYGMTPYPGAFFAHQGPMIGAKD